MSEGFHLARPLLADTVNERHKRGLPFTGDQRLWLLSEAVITFGGFIAERAEYGQEAAMAGATDDFRQLAHVAGMLGQVEEHGDAVRALPAFQTAVYGAAGTVLVDLAENVVRLAEAFEAHPGEWPEATIQVALEQLGSPRGSHRHLLDDLARLVQERGDPDTHREMTAMSGEE